ncbi:S1C family serine protease [Streptomyces yaanensis]
MAPPPLPAHGAPIPAAPAPPGVPIPPAPAEPGAPVPPAPASMDGPIPPAPASMDGPIPPAPALPGAPISPAPASMDGPIPPAPALPGAPISPAPAPADGPIPPAPALPGAPIPPAPAPADGPIPPAPAPTDAPIRGAAEPSVSIPGMPVPAPAVPAAPPGVPPAPAAPVPAPAPYPATPWQSYDPWAPRAPFQQTGAAVATQEQRRKRGKRVLVVGAVLIALVAGGVGGVVGAALERNSETGDVRLPQAGVEPKGRPRDSVAGIAARALPSVVTLHVKGTEAAGTGTGFVLDERGHILTNNHVVEPAGAGGEITVTFNSGETAKATVVGRDTGYDLAVVKVSGVHGLRPMPLGNSDNVQVGDPVVAIGAPFDLAGTVTSGIISATERPITAGGEKGDGSDVSYVDALQTDAPINPGNSGGPLLDSKGRVVGINSAIRSADSGSDKSGQAGSIGLGFAIPVNQAKRVAEELINTGKATHPVIGVTLDMNYTGDGARVDAKGAGGGPAVNRSGPGHKAGIKPGDVITEVDGVRVHSGEELIIKTRAHRPGDRLELTVVRDGAARKITLVLGSADGN